MHINHACPHVCALHCSASSEPMPLQRRGDAEIQGRYTPLPPAAAKRSLWNTVQYTRMHSSSRIRHPLMAALHMSLHVRGKAPTHLWPHCNALSLTTRAGPKRNGSSYKRVPSGLYAELPRCTGTHARARRVTRPPIHVETIMLHKVVAMRYALRPRGCTPWRLWRLTAQPQPPAAIRYEELGHQ